MRTFRLLLVPLCSIFLGYSSISSADDSVCELSASIELDYSAGSSTKNKASVVLQDGFGSIKYIFYEEFTGRMLQEDLNKNSVENLKQGSYLCLIIDEKGCNKKIHFQIQ